MYISYLGDKVLQWFRKNILLSGTHVLTFPNGQKYITIATAAISRLQAGAVQVAMATGNITPSWGSGTDNRTQAAGTTCYYVVTMPATAGATPGFKLYKGVDGRDAFPDLQQAILDNEIPIVVHKVVTVANDSYTAITDNWDDAAVSAHTMKVLYEGYLTVDKPSDLTYGSAV